MGKRKYWWNCKYMISPIGVAYCKKTDDFCLKKECNHIETVFTKENQYSYKR